MSKLLFIPGNTPSSKNSKIKTSRGIFNSPVVTRYLRSLGVKHYSSSRKIVEGFKTSENKFEAFRSEWFKQLGEGSGNPTVVGFHFVRDSKRKFDFHNAVQIIADLMVAHDFIEDDCMDYFIPMPLKLEGKWFSHDKLKPGVYVQVLKK